MLKEKKQLLIPLSLIATLLVYCWYLILNTEILATWRHYIGLVLFALIIYLYFTKINWAIIATGIFLLLATFNMLAVTTTISTFGIRIATVKTPDVQYLSLGLFIIYLFLNIDSLINIYVKKQLKKEVKK